jgi:dTDP-4-dehydrorhamnose reductase
MKVFVLGHKGMLGHVVFSHLSSLGIQVVTSDLRYSGEAHDSLIKAVCDSQCEWVINAIGLVKQKSSNKNDLFRMNAIFPIHLLQHLHTNQRLIHASTDCVFSGRRGWYSSSDVRDADDDYGLSKALGEQIAIDPRVLVFRVSIIGPEQQGGTGLLQWFLDNRQDVSGFTNHLWNGITTLEWAHAASEVIRNLSAFRHGLVNLGSVDVVSKYDLLMIISSLWGKNIAIKPIHHNVSVDRTLEPDWVRPSVTTQLMALKKWVST